MTLRTIEEAAERTIEPAMDSDPELGYLWRPDHALPPEARLLGRLGFSAPPPERWVYWEGPNGERYCYNTQPLDPRWWAPERWACWTERKVAETDTEEEWERIDWRFADLRREAKEEALARLAAAESEEA